MATIAYNEAADRTILAEMERDPTIFTFGYRSYKDCMRGIPTSELPSVMEKFGYDRIGYTGICETQEVGAGLGAALAGTRPIVALGRTAYMADGWGQIAVQTANSRFKEAYKLDCPVVVRLGSGTFDGAESVHHTACFHNWLANAPGLLVAYPSTAADVRGLWRTTLRQTKDPVVMLDLEPPLQSIKWEVPDGDYTIPFGVADIKRAGKDVTIAATGYMVHLALAAAKDLATQGIEAEVWDPRTLTPFDRPSLLASVKKTGAMVVVDRAPKSFGTTGEFAMTVAEAVDAFIPMARVAHPWTLRSPTAQS